MPRVVMSCLLSSWRPRVIASDRSSRGVLSARTARRAEATMRIGFIGLGNMGGPMALNLMKAGHTLVVHDVRRQAATPHLDGGAAWAASPQEAARGNELILSSVPGPPEVEQVALGKDGVVHGAARGAV